MKIQPHHHLEDSARAQQLQRALKTQGIDTEGKPYPPRASESKQQTLLCFSLSLWHDPDWAAARHQEFTAHIYLDDTPLNQQQRLAEHHFDLHDWQPGIDHHEFQRLVTFLSKSQSETPATTLIQKRTPIRKAIAWVSSAIVALGTFYSLISGHNEVSAVLCGSLVSTSYCINHGWGGYATPQQQSDFQQAVADGCDGLRQFMTEEGHHEAHLAKAQRIIQAAEIIQTDHWENANKAHPFYQPAGIINHPSEMAAREYTKNNAQHQAEQQCQGYLSNERDQLIGTTINIEEWQCNPHAKNTWDCSAKGTAQCQLRLYQPKSQEQCNTQLALAKD